MYDYYDYSSTVDTYNQATGFGMIIELAIAIYIIFITWKVFEKAGRKGWECIIPFYNIYVYFTIAGLAWWYIILMFVPLVNIYVAVHFAIELAHRFNKSTAFGFGLLFLNPIFMSILAFEKDTVYTPKDGSSNMNGSNNSSNYNNNYNTNQNNMNGYNGMNANSMYNTNNMNNNGMNQPNNMSNNSNNYGPIFNPTSNTNMNNIPSFNNNNNSTNNNTTTNTTDNNKPLQ